MLDWFDGRIAAEMRLWDAIDQHRLVPFLYFGIHDGTDLTKVPWRAGRGYDVEGLTNVLTADDALARLIIKQLIEKVTDIHSIRALGFCVSVEHARYMARVFSQSGIKSVAVWADTPKNERRSALKALADDKNKVVTLGYFLDISDLDLTDIYTQTRGWSEKRLFRMLVSSLTSQIANKQTTLSEGWQIIARHPQICKETIELLEVLETRINHVQHPLENHPNVPLLIHASYTRIDILSAFGIGDEDAAQARQWREGVLWAPDVPADLLAFTLDKTNGQFSPTTRYKDYAINRSLIHWESQSTTSATSETGTRYQQHKQRGSSVMLFARERSDERAFLFLGMASYVSHKSERPMAITWKLNITLPGDVYAAYAAVVA